MSPRCWQSHLWVTNTWLFGHYHNNWRVNLNYIHYFIDAVPSSPVSSHVPSRRRCCHSFCWFFLVQIYYSAWWQLLFRSGRFRISRKVSSLLIAVILWWLYRYFIINYRLERVNKICSKLIVILNIDRNDTMVLVVVDESPTIPWTVWS